MGRDVRLDSPLLAAALARGLNGAGASVIDIGLCGTEEVCFQTAHRGVGGDIMVAASHNPVDYLGMMLIRDRSVAIRVSMTSSIWGRLGHSHRYAAWGQRA